jgi:hypothetical protein
MKLKYSLAIASALAAMGTAHAATISWSNQPYTVNGGSGQNLDTGIFQTDGTLLLADNTGSTNNITFNGIAFTAGTINFGNNYGGFHASTTPEQPSTTGTWAYGIGTVSLTGLTAGNSYRVQALIYDGRGGQNGRTVEFDGIDQGVYAHGIANTTWGDGMLVTGTFVADAATQDFTIEVFETDGTGVGGQLNALLVHEVPEPSSATLFGGLACLALLRRRRK